MIVDTDKKPKTKIVVLKPQIELERVEEIINKEKTKLFRRFLKTPSSEEVHVHSLVLTYEPIMIISGVYEADFLRKATHNVKVENNVKELIFGDGVFTATNYSNSESIGSKLKTNLVSISLEEHVFVSKEKEMVFDHHGKQRDFTYKVDAEVVERYPKRMLKKNNVKEFEITEQAAIKKLAKELQSHETFEDVRDINESLSIHEITEVYLPIYEARLVGPKKKVEILRLDAVKKKIL